MVGFKTSLMMNNICVCVCPYMLMYGGEKEREKESKKGEKTQFQECVLIFGMASKFKFMGTSQDVFIAHIFITRSLFDIKFNLPFEINNLHDFFSNISSEIIYFTKPMLFQ